MGSEQYQLITLPNGLRVVHQRVKGTQLVHAGLPNDPATHQALSSVFQNRLQWREWQDDGQTRWVALPK